MKLAMVFPGQGSQAVGMLKGYDGLPEVNAVRDEASRVLGMEFLSILDQGPDEKLDQTVNTQPAMVTAGYAAYRAWRALGGAQPAVVAGHSLGEYTALTAAGALRFADCLPLVRFRAQAMQEAVPRGKGAMAAILGLDDDAVRAACAEAGGEVQAVNFNAPGQVVIAGEAGAVARATEKCKARGAKRAMPLPVSAPFHSSLMRPAADRLKEYIAKVSLVSPSITVINNVDVRTETDPLKIRDALVRQAASPVRWVEIIRAMLAMGATHIVECGPGKVLAGLTKRIAKDIPSFALADRASLELALKEIGQASKEVGHA
jgi:[acyl-carrier-protein] S-malonyltransferase